MEGGDADAAARRAGHGARESLQDVRALAAAASAAAPAPRAGALAAAASFRLANAANAARGLARTPHAAPDRLALASEMRRLGGRVFAAGEYPAAIQVYNAAHDVFDGDPRLLGNMASCCLNMGNFQGCVRLCDSALAALPGAPAPGGVPGLDMGTPEGRSLAGKLLKRKAKALIHMESWGDAREALDAVPRDEPCRDAAFLELQAEVEAGCPRAEAAEACRDGADVDGDLGAAEGDALLLSDSDSDGDRMPALISESDGDDGCGMEGSDSGDSSAVPSLGDSDSDGNDYEGPDEINFGDNEWETTPWNDEDGGNSADLVFEYSASEGRSRLVSGPSRDLAARLRVETPALDPATVTAPAGFWPGFLDQARPRGVSAPANAPPAEFEEPPALGMSDDDGAGAADCTDSSTLSSDSDASLGDGSADGQSDSSDDEDMPGLAESESDSDADPAFFDLGTGQTFQPGCKGGGGFLRGESSLPLVGASGAGGSSEGLRKASKKGRTKASRTEKSGEDNDYDSATTSYSAGSDYDDNDGSVFRADFMSDECVRSQLGPYLQVLIDATLGKSFLSPQRLVDFDRFFGAHVPKAGAKAPKKKGKRPQQCSMACGNCWARRMFRARFPWRPADGATSSSSTQPPPSSSAIPDGLSDKARSVFLATGGFGSGRELYVSLVSAVVHAYAYICLLQCELSWRDEHIMPRVKDAQSCLEAMLAEEGQSMDPESVTYQVGLMLNVINQCIVDGYFRSPSREWDMGRRASEVCKHVALDVDAPKLSISASTMAGLPVTSSNKDFALYSNGYAWARVGRIDHDEELVFASLARDATYRTRTCGINPKFEDCMRDGIAMRSSAFCFARITRRCLFERAKYMELQAGDAEILGGPGLPPEPPYSKSSLLKAAVGVAAENLNAALGSGTDVRGEMEAAVHMRAVNLYSEAFKRVPRPRLLLKRAKRYMLLGKLTDARNDLKKAMSMIQINSHSDGKYARGRGELEAEIRRVCCLLHLRRVQAAHGASQREKCADQAFQEVTDIDSLESEVSRNTMARLRWLGDQVEHVVVAAIAAADREKRHVSQEASSFEPEPADLPSASPGESGPSCASAPAASAFEKSSEVPKARDAPPPRDDDSVYLGDEVCSFTNCGKPSRRILRKEEWAESQCECCVVVQCHKNCYRAHSKLLTSHLCPKCKDYPIMGKPIFMTVDTADEKRSKRVPVRPSRPGARPSRSVVSGETAASTTSPRDSGREPESDARPSSGTGGSSASVANNVTADRLKVPMPSDDVSREVASPGSASCDVCNKHFNGPKQFEMHMASQKHLQKVANARRSESAGTSTGTAYSPSYRPFSTHNRSSGEVDVARSSSRIAEFNLVDAISCVKTALRTFPNGEACLSELRLALDMTSYGVADAGKYFDENWKGLRTFVFKQSRHFTRIQENFREYDYRVKIAQSAPAPVWPGRTAFVDRSDALTGSLQVSASQTPAASPPAFAHGSFPALAEGLGCSEIETAVREPPAAFHFGSSSKTATSGFRPEDVEGYSPPGEDVANPCVICFDRSATHQIASCECASGYCEKCINEWIEKGKARRRGGKARAATCPTCTIVIDGIAPL